MHLFESMKLTEAQRNNINRFDTELALDNLHECAERLGLVSVKEYCEIMGAKKLTVYGHVAQNKLRHTRLSEHIFIIIND